MLQHGRFILLASGCVKGQAQTAPIILKVGVGSKVWGVERDPSGAPSSGLQPSVSTLGELGAGLKVCIKRASKENEELLSSLKGVALVKPLLQIRSGELRVPGTRLPQQGNTGWTKSAKRWASLFRAPWACSA